HSVARATISERVIAQLICKICAVTLPITIKPHPPAAGSWESERVTVVATVAKVCQDHDIIARPSVFPTMKRNHLVSVVDVMDVDLLTTKTARLIEPIAPQPNQVAIEKVDTGVRVKLRPVEGRRVAKVFIFKKL